jgi:uncharacterized membrane protein YbhN (UPF0104 family)
MNNYKFYVKQKCATVFGFFIKNHRPILTLFFIILFIVYFINNREKFVILTAVSREQIALVVLGQLLVLVSNAGLLQLIAKTNRKLMGASEAVQVTFYSSIVNFFGFLQAGIGYRALYLKNKHNIAYKDYTGLTLVHYIMIFLSAILAGAVAYANVSNMMASAYIILLLAAIIVLGLFIKRNQLTNLVMKTRLKNIYGISFNRRFILWSMILIIIQFIGLLISFGAELSAVGAHVSAAALVLYTSVVIISILFAFTPGGIGIRETLLLLVASQMSLSVKDVILSATIDRVIYFLLLLALTPSTVLWSRRVSASKAGEQKTTSTKNVV